MNRWLLSALFALTSVASIEGQTATDPNEGARMTQGAGGSFTLSWWGHTGRTYFLQHSTDLASWIYFPDVIESGTGASSSYGFTISGVDRYFLRLCYSDIPTSDPATADFDGDGIGSHDELLAGLNPLSSDTDGDGIDDSSDPFPLEAATGTAPVVTILAPLTGSSSLTSNVTVTATVTADRPLDEVRINSVLVSDSGGQYSRTLTLAEGPQDIIVSARTTEGRVTVAHRSMVVDALPPNVAIESPADEQVFLVEYARVRVLAESNTATVTINGSATTRNGYYSYAWVHLVSGANTLTALLTEAGGNLQTR